MDVSPGEIIHMDENGACKFPAARLSEVLTNVRALQEEEEARMAALRQARSAAEVRAVFAGKSYAAPRRSA
jgi:regulator of RNase E activity RraA